MRRLGATAAAALSLALLVAGPGTVASAASTHPKIRTSATAVWPALMCPSCHEPLALAQSPQAIQERQYVQLLVNKGYTRQQILNIMVAQYSTAVLAKPPATGFNLAIYILPPALVAAGIAFLLYTLPKWRARARKAATEPMAGGGTLPLTDEDAERLDADLAAFDRK
jgi:cytochrome c-type biogenesis protein CcmH/NrfF